MLFTPYKIWSLIYILCTVYYSTRHLTRFQYGGSFGGCMVAYLFNCLQPLGIVFAVYS